jgi:hypothetical protein
MPVDAVGFVVLRPDRPDHLALFRPDGALSNTFAIDDTLATLEPILARHSLLLLADGSVVRA